MRKIQVTLLFVAIFLIVVGCNGGEDTFEGQNNYDLTNGNMNQDQTHPYSNISSESTDIPSAEFPHTKAVQVQQAKYTFEVQVGQQGQQGQQQPKGGQTKPSAPGNQATPGSGDASQHGGGGTAAPAKENQQAQNQEQASEGLSQAEQQVINLTNAERRNNGLSELQADTSLSNVARTKSQDMRENNYFSHTSPTYGSPFDMIRDFGVQYNAAAENIAQGQQSPEQVVQSWMNSEGHRKNILNGNYTHIGVGYDENGHYWTQMFISR